MSDNNNNHFTEMPNNSLELLVECLRNFQDLDLAQIHNITTVLNEKTGSNFSPEKLKENVEGLHKIAVTPDALVETVAISENFEALSLVATATQILEHTKELQSLAKNEELSEEEKQEQATELIAQTKKMFSVEFTQEVSKKDVEEISIKEDFVDFPIDNMEESINYVMKQTGLEQQFSQAIPIKPIEPIIETITDNNPIEIEEVVLEETITSTNYANTGDGVEVEQVAAEIETSMNSLFKSLDALQQNVNGI